MKHFPLFLCALAAACLLASCNSDDAFYSVGGGTSKSLGPATYGPIYYNPGVYPAYSDRPGYYHRIPSIPGSYHYVFNDVAQPANTPLKPKTWRYTSRSPSTWGARIWVTSFTPLHSVTQAHTVAVTPAR